MRSYYSATKYKFYCDTSDQILGELAKLHNFPLEISQKNAWLNQIKILRQELNELDDFKIFFEFEIPRMGKRVDVVIIISGIIFLIEFKSSSAFERSDIDQVEDYALDLKNFHEASHNLTIYPILLPVLAKSNPHFQIEMAIGQVAKPILLCSTNLGFVINLISKSSLSSEFDLISWERSPYRPTPNIIEAARSLYSRHGVKDITRNDAGAINLTNTQNAISSIINYSKINSKKSIVFITGVPGAGKTLAGLNIATSCQFIESANHATFLSGNGPLVDVLKEALARDQHLRGKVKKSEAERKVKNFIQNVHVFRDEYLRDPNPPIDKVVIFDEAQRAWSLEQASKFMQTKRNVLGFEMSEPEFLLSVMDRHKDWCTIICLIGGGQEINTGEAGLSEWINAISKSYLNWKVYISDKINLPEYDIASNLKQFLYSPNVSIDNNLHLGVSLRSFRAEFLADFVQALLSGETNKATIAYNFISKNYPIVITRNLENAKKWIREKSRGSERSGLLASSGAIRLKPEGLNIKAKIDPANWFLNPKDDVRSSNYLEDAATEFDVQGLELDWTGVCWDANFRYNGNGWSYHNFKGTKWQNINDDFRKVYLKNAYRVLLTRARQGMVLYIPLGDVSDYTRKPCFYDQTYNYLKSIGLCDV